MSVPTPSRASSETALPRNANRYERGAGNTSARDSKHGSRIVATREATARTPFGLGRHS